MNKLLNTFGIVLSLLTATGVFIHDVKIDHITPAAIKTAAKKSAYKTPHADLGLSTSDHIHPEQINRTLQGFAYKTPMYPPRVSRMKRHLLQNYEPRARHAFDSYYLPEIG